MKTIHPVRLAVIGLVAAVSIVTLAAPAYAAPTYNNVNVSVSGSDANVVSACLRYASFMAYLGRPARSNACRYFVRVQEDSLILDRADVAITSPGGWPVANLYDVPVAISGSGAGPAVSCGNYLRGTATSQQAASCAGQLRSVGAGLDFDNVNVAVLRG